MAFSISWRAAPLSGASNQPDQGAVLALTHVGNDLEGGCWMKRTPAIQLGPKEIPNQT